MIISIEPSVDTTPPNRERTLNAQYAQKTVIKQSGHVCCWLNQG